MRFGFQFHEDITDEFFRYLQKCEKFHEHCIFYKQPAQTNIKDFFELGVWHTESKREKKIATFPF